MIGVTRIGQQALKSSSLISSITRLDAQATISRSQPSETSLLQAELGGRQFMGVGGSGTSAWDFHYSTQYGKHGSMRHSTFRLKLELEVLVG